MTYDDKNEKFYLLPCLVFSLLIHSVIFYFLFFSLGAKPQKTVEPRVVTVFFEPPPNFKKIAKELNTQSENQIVTPPENKEGTPKIATKFKSDKNFQTEKEQIKRGDGLDYGKVLGETSKAPKEPSKKFKKPAKKNSESEKIATKKTDSSKQKLNLKLNSSNKLLEKISKDALKEPQDKKLSINIQPFSRAEGQGAKFLGFSGSSDFLPNVKDGDVTFLNAKADKFAVFVRRVAVRVFNQIKQDGWRNLSRGDIKSISQYCFIEAVLDKSGNLEDLFLKKGSGSPRFDNMLKTAVRKSVKDPHPIPSAVAEDGKYHFIFKARSWSMLGGTREGGFSERRWLVLGTGLL